MKLKFTSEEQNNYDFVFIFLSSFGLGYALVNKFIFDKPKTELLLLMICLFIISVISWQREKKDRKKNRLTYIEL